MPPDDGEGLLQSRILAFKPDDFLFEFSDPGVGRDGSAGRAFVGEAEEPVGGDSA